MALFHACNRTKAEHIPNMFVSLAKHELKRFPARRVTHRLNGTCIIGPNMLSRAFAIGYETTEVVVLLALPR